MNENTASDSNDPLYHTSNLRKMLTQVIDHARSDVSKVSDPKAQALFETTAEVLGGLRKALEDFEKRDEPAWRQAS